MPREAPKPQQFKPRTAEQAVLWLRANGVTVSQFARANGLNRNAVQDLLRGRTQGNFGEAHSAAVALGMKAPPNFATNFQSPTPRE